MPDFKPPGWPSLVPRLFAADSDRLAVFLKSAFGAEGDIQAGRPTELVIDGSVVLVSDGGGVREPTASFLYLYVPNCDETYARALSAGAASVEAPLDTTYGDRRATVRDPGGNTWQIATKRS
jgi:PhnB protein